MYYYQRYDRDGNYCGGYPSQKIAAEMNFVCRGAISQNLQGKTKYVQGKYYFKKIETKRKFSGKFKAIKGFEHFYYVTDSGKILSFADIEKKPKFICSLDAGGDYYTVRLRTIENPKQFMKFKIHRLVAIAFLPNPNNYLVVHHKDGNKFNNHVKNLEWVTHRQNSLQSYLSGRKPKKIQCRKVAKLDNEFKIKEIYSSVTEAARIHNCTDQTIFNAAKKKRRGRGFYWKFVS